MAIADVGDRKLYYELIDRSPPDEGDPIPITEPPPLVLLNGIGGSCRGWLPLQVPELSKSRSLLLLDHRGVGESSDTGKPFTNTFGDPRIMGPTTECGQAGQPCESNPLARSVTLAAGRGISYLLLSLSSWRLISHRWNCEIRISLLFN